MKICLIPMSYPQQQNVQPWFEEFERQGVTCLHNYPDEDTDFILLSGHAMGKYGFPVNLTHDAIEKYPDIPVISYVWDFYDWFVSHQVAYDWHKHLWFYNHSAEVWVPSEEVKLRLMEEGNGNANLSLATEDYNLRRKHEEMLGDIDYKMLDENPNRQYIDLHPSHMQNLRSGENIHVIKSWARTFDWDKSTEHKGYVLNPMRQYQDPQEGWLAKIERDSYEESKYDVNKPHIPVVRPNHGKSEADWQKVLAECTFICTEFHEASTGGLSLIEAHNLGKPVVISDSKYMGARDYLGDRAIYFKDGDFEDFKRVITETYKNPPKLDKAECEKWVKENIPSLEQMVSEMISRMKNLLTTNPSGIGDPKSLKEGCTWRWEEKPWTKWD